MSHIPGAPCTTCGHKPPRSYRHRMDLSKLDLLEKVGALNQAGIPWVKVQRDGGLIPDAERPTTIQCDDVHALRLSWFGLLQKRAPRSGEYLITHKGIHFLAGRETVPAWIECRGGRVLDQAVEEIGVDAVRKVILDKGYWDLYARGLSA